MGDITITKVRKTVELIKEDEDWAESYFPGLSLPWIHQALLRAFRERVEQEQQHILNKYIQLGADEVKKQLLDES